MYTPSEHTECLRTVWLLSAYGMPTVCIHVCLLSAYFLPTFCLRSAYCLFMGISVHSMPKYLPTFCLLSAYFLPTFCLRSAYALPISCLRSSDIMPHPDRLQA